MTQEYADRPVHWSIEEQEGINNALKECVDSLVRENAEKQYRKDVVEMVQEKFSIKPAMFNALLKERFEAKSTSTLEKHEEIVAINEMLINNSRNKQ